MINRPGLEIDIDPASIHVGKVSDMVTLLKGYIAAALQASALTGQVYQLYHAINPRTGEDSYKVSSKAESDFVKELITCPQDADILFAQTQNKPRPLPSAVVQVKQRQATIIVSKPDLCDTCIHRLSRTVTNNCSGLRYKNISEI